MEYNNCVNSNILIKFCYVNELEVSLEIERSHFSLRYRIRIYNLDFQRILASITHLTCGLQPTVQLKTEDLVGYHYFCQIKGSKFV